MFIYEKKLQYPVKIANCNPKLASFIISQYGGPDGELGASLRYLSQRYSMPYPEPVSYTHLDVYKRQTRSCSSRTSCKFNETNSEIRSPQLRNRVRIQ